LYIVVKSHGIILKRTSQSTFVHTLILKNQVVRCVNGQRCEVAVSFLNGAVATVRAKDGLLESFDKTVSYLRIFIIATDQVETRNVSSVQGNANTKNHVHFDENTKKNKNKKGKTSINRDDRYYKPTEWWALSQEIRDSILAKRKVRKPQTPAVSTESTTQQEKQVSSVQTIQRR
jgi:hypothetical protein